jgi:CDP-diacylglycerol--serine O-phosphatidyltransferase
MKFLETQTVRYFLIAAALAPPPSSSTSSMGASRGGGKTHSALGRELDSLADVISFGVAPAALGFAAGLHGGWDWVALTYFVCCGVGRLARFNVTAEKLSGRQRQGQVFRRHADSDQRVLTGSSRSPPGTDAWATACIGASGNSAPGSSTRSCCCSFSPAH